MKNILFVTYDFPYPTTSGGKNRAYHLLKYSARKANIFLYSFVREDYNPENNEEILKLGVKDIKVFKRKKVTSFLNLPRTIITNSSIFKTLYFDEKVMDDLVKIIKEKEIDIVHFESTYTGFYIGGRLKKLGVKTVLGTENIEYQLYFDYAKQLKNLFLKPVVFFQAQRLKKEELSMVDNSDVTTTITKNESDILKKITNKTPLIVANGIEPDLYEYSPNKTLKNNILFVGNFSYFPNVEAIEFFYNKVFKNINGNFTFTIIGKKCNEKFKFNNLRVIQKDFVENIIEEYRNCDMLVFPIRIGGGTNFKVLEAMSLGVPIIAQPERLAGLRAIPEEHYLEATSAEDYEDQIKRLYTDTELRKTLCQNARNLIEKYYSWEGIGNDLLAAWGKAL